MPKVPDLVAHERMSQGDRSRVASVSSWCLCTFLFSRLCAYRGTHVRNVSLRGERVESSSTILPAYPCAVSTSPHGGLPVDTTSTQAVKCDRSPLAMRSCST